MHGDMKHLTISKSKYLSGRQCSKLLWYQYNAKDLIPPVDAGTQHKFDEGHRVGELAKLRFPAGIEVKAAVYDFDEIVRQSTELLKERKPLFEAGFVYNHTLARVDVLFPAENGTWDIIEVKSSTQVKPENYHDVALQRYCYEGTGIAINRCFLMYINTQYVRKGEIDVEQLFSVSDITDKVLECTQEVEPRIQEMLEVIGLEDCPDIPIGPQCTDPYECGLIPVCWSFLPENNVATFYRLGTERTFQLIGCGIRSISDMPPDYPLKPNQEIQKETDMTGEAHINRQTLGEFLRSLQFPQYHLDFETFSSPVPPYDNTRPYMQIPFQFSLHVWRSYETEPEHYSFLADGTGDPRPAFLARLRELLGDRGSIVVYNQSFEKGRLKELALLFPEYADWITALTPRFADLLVPFRNFDYYNPAQHGSASLKAVLPALTGKTYEGLEIAEGGSASREFMRIALGEVDDAERQVVRRNLEEYCRQDTQAMVDIVKELHSLVV